jgi:tripartite-type tricarboxylate transporter receptor subunit TctC
MNVLFQATTRAVQQPEVSKVLVREGTEVALSRSPADFAAFLAEDSRFWQRLVKEAGVTID